MTTTDKGRTQGRCSALAWAAVWVAVWAAVWAGGGAVGKEPASGSGGVERLTEQAKELQNQVGEGAKGVGALAAELVRAYAAASASGAVNWDEWIPVVTPVGEYLPPETRAGMSKSLAQVDIAKASHAKLKSAYECMLALGDDGGAVALARRWVNGASAYKELAWPSLLELSLFVPPGGDDGGAGRRVGEAVLDKLLSEPGVAPSLRCVDWCDLTLRVAPGLDAARKEQWVAKLQQMYADRALTWDELQRLVQVAGELGRQDKSAFVAAWMARKENHWEALGTERILVLAGQLGGATETAALWRGKIVAWADKTFLATPETVQAQASMLGGVIQGLSPCLSADQKQQWRSRVREAFNTKAGVTPGELQTVAGWLGGLGEAGDGYLAEWTLAQTSWQGWKGAELSGLLGQLGAKTEAGKAAREKVAAHVLGVLVSRPEVVAAMPAVELEGLVSSAAPSWTPVQSRQGLEAMRAAFGGKSMPVQTLRSLEAVMRPLGDGTFVAFVSEWVNGQTGWREFSLADLNALHEVLKASPSGKPARASVAARLTEVILGDAKALQAAAVGSVCQAAEGMVPDMSAEVRGRWTAALRSAYGRAPLAPAELTLVVGALRALGDGQSEEFVPRWVAGQASWKAWPANELAGMLGQLRGTGELTRSARGAVAAHVATRVVRPEFSDGLSPEALGALVESAIGDWTDAQRSEYLKSLRGGRGGKAMSLATVRSMEPACRPLGDGAIVALVCDWVNGQPDWGPCSPTDLKSLYEMLKVTEAAKPAREKVASQLTAALLDNVAAFQGASVTAVCETARGIASDLTPARRERWVTTLRAHFAKAPLDRAALTEAAEALQALGDLHGQEFIAQWVVAQTSWQALSSQDVAELLAQVKGSSELAKACRSKLAGHLATTLGRPETLGTMPANVLTPIVAAGAPVWTSGQRAEVLGAAGKALALRPVSVQALQSMAAAMAPLGEEAFLTAVSGWLNGLATWQQVSLEDLNALHGLLKSVRAARPTREKLVAQITTATLGNTQLLQPAGLAALCQTARALAPDATAAVREQWIQAVRTLANKAPLNNTELIALRGHLEGMGDAKSAEFIPAWVSVSGSWKTWPAEELSSLMKTLGSAGGAKNARAAVAGEALATFAKPGALTALPVATLVDLLQAVVGDWTDAQRAQCLAAIRGGLGPVPMSLAVLQSTEPIFRPLDEAAFPRFVAEWIDGQPAWKQFPLADLNALYELVKTSDGAKPARAKVVAQINAATLGNVQAADAAGLAQLCLTARGMATDLTPAAREQWITALRTASIKIPLNNAELAAMQENLKTLGDAKSDEFVSTWVEAQGSWKARPAEELAGLMKSMPATGPGKAARAAVASEILAVLARPGGAAGMPEATLTNVLQAAVADWTDAQRGQVLTAMRSAFVAKATSLQALQSVEPSFRPLGEGVFLSFVGDWLDGQPAWQQFSPDDLNQLYELLKAPQAPRAGREKVVARISAALLGHAASLKPAELAALGVTARSLRQDLTGALREQWAATLRTIAAKKALNNTELASLRETLQAMGDAKCDEFIPGWMTEQGSWKSWSNEDLSALGVLLGAGDSAKSARGLIAAHRADTITQPGVLAEMSVETLGQFVQSSSGSWGPTQRSQCLKAIRGAYRAKAMPLATLQSLAVVFQALDAQTGYLPFVGEWVDAQGGCWQKYPRRDLEALYGLLKGSEAVTAARKKVVAQLTTAILGDTKAPQGGAVASLCQDARTLLPDATSEVQEQWAGAIRTKFAKAPLTRPELTDIQDTLQALGDRRSDGFVNNWTVAQGCWKTWAVSDLASLAKIGGTSPDMKAVRARASAHMMGMATARPEVLGAMPTAALGGLVQSVGGTWTDAQRAHAAAAVRAAYKAKPMSVADLQSLEPIFLALADVGFLAFAQEWVTAQPCWQKDSPADLISLYQLLRRCESAQVARGKVVSQLTATVLGDGKALQASSAGTLCNVVRTVLPDTPDALRGQWATTLRTMFAKAPLATGDLAIVRDTLQALGDTASEQFIPYWVANQACWKNWPPQDLPGLVAQLNAKTDSCKAARGTIAAHAMATTIAQPEALAALPIGTLASLVQAMAPEWTEAHRTACLEAVRSAYAGKPMSLENLRSLEGVFRPLGEMVFAGFVADWLEKQTSWQEAPANELLSLYELLRNCGAPKTTREKVATVLTATVMGNAQALQAMSLGQRCQMAQLLAPAATGAVRDQWVALLRASFPSAVNTGDLSGLRDSFKALGDVRFEECMSEWVASQTGWREWSAGDLAGLAGMLGNSPATRAAREALALRATEKFLANGAAVPEGGWGIWRALAVSLGNELAPDQRVRWADKILAAFTAGTDAAQGVRVGEAVEVARSLQALGQADKLADSALSWLESGGNYEWPKLSLGDFVALAVCVGAKDKDRAAGFLSDLEAKVLRSSKLNWEGYRDVASAWGQLGETEKAKAWYVRLCEADLTNELSSMSVWNVAVRLSETGCVAPGKGNPAYATALAKLANSGQLSGPAPLWEHDTMWGEPLGSPEARAIVQAEVTDPAGNPRLNVANILAWANKFDNNMPAWLAYLDTQAQNATDGDVKATWLRAKAYARTIMPDQMSPRNGMTSLKQALTAASSDEMRMTVIEDYATYSRAIGQPIIAANLIESMKGQLSEGTLAGAMRMQQLQESLRAEDAARKAAFEQHQAVLAASQRKATLDDYYRRLAAAEAAGNTDEAANLRAAIANIENNK